MSQKNKLIILVVALVAVIAIGGGAYALTTAGGIKPAADELETGAKTTQSTQGAQNSSDASSQKSDAANSDDEADPTDALVNSTQPTQKAQNISDLTVKTYDGADTTIKQIGDKPKYIAFWATWCPSCVKEAPVVQKLYEKYGDKVDFVLINEEGSTKAEFDKGRQWIVDEGYNYPTYYDETQDTGVALGIMYLPTTILTDKDGNIIDGFAGMKSEEVLTQKIENLLA